MQEAVVHGHVLAAWFLPAVRRHHKLLSADCTVLRAMFQCQLDCILGLLQMSVPQYSWNQGGTLALLRCRWGDRGVA